MILGLAEKPPVLDDKSFPDASRNLNSISNKLALLAQLQINLLSVVLSPDVRHVDGDQNIRVLLFEAQQSHGEGREVWSGVLVAGVACVGGLRCDEGVCGVF